jgi:hypothetical protein
MNRGYTVLKLRDLVKKLGLPGSKDFKTTEYLELVINSIEERGLRFIQFLQLVDVLYVIVQREDQSSRPSRSSNTSRPEPTMSRPVKTEVSSRKTDFGEVITAKTERQVSEKMDYPEELKEVKQGDTLKKELNKNPLPWQK